MVRVSRDEKERSRARIIERASRLFRRRGVEGASVSDVMTAAGLTHGGFYRHFASKDALLVAALGDAFSEMVGMMASGLGAQPAAAVHQAFREFYLSTAHLNAPEAGCPAAALGGDIARATPVVKQAFGAGLSSMIDALSRTIKVTGDDRRGEAIRELSMMVGAVMLARASDPQTGAAILAACRGDQRHRVRGALSGVEHPAP